MKILTKRKFLIVGLIVLLFVSLTVGLMMTTQKAKAVTDETVENYDDEFVVTDTLNEVLATYNFTRLNDTECSVRIANKSVATRAIVPKEAVIEGVTYKVKEVAANGFMSSAKLQYVKFLGDIRKIGNMAFYNCSALTRVSLRNVQEIGNSAFYKCTNLEKLHFPTSVTTIGNTILRYCNTQVYVHAGEDGNNWSSTWNSGNENQEVDYSNTVKEPTELETVYAEYSTFARAAEPHLEGYIVSSAQQTDKKYYDIIDNNIFIPNEYDGVPIIGIGDGAFEENHIKQIIVEYDTTDINIKSNAFVGVDCENITINRNITYDDLSDNIFTGCQAATIVLPDNINGFVDCMFADCNNLTNIYFASPKYIRSRTEMLNIINNLYQPDEEGIVHLPKLTTFSTIGESAFSGATGIKELHIYDNVINAEASIFDFWEEWQKVIIHNEDKNFTKNWHRDVFSGIKAEIVYSAKYHTITFDPTGGTVDINSLEVAVNDVIGELPIPVVSYKVFLGWYDENGNEYTAETVYSVDSDIILTAKWRNFIYNVQYKANRPNEAPNPVVGDMVNSVHEYNVHDNLSKNLFTIAGWRFTGWNTKEDGTGTAYTDQADFINLCKEDNGVVVLFAQWVGIKYNFNYTTNDPDGASNVVQGSMSQSKHIYGIPSCLTDNEYTLTGWHFVGWNTEPNGSGDNLTDGQNVTYLAYENDKSINLYAQWEMNEYTIVYDSNRPDKASNPVVGTMSSSVVKYEESYVLNRNCYTIKGWFFTGWRFVPVNTGIVLNDCQEVKFLTDVNDGVVTLYVAWVYNSYNIKYEKNLPDAVTGSYQVEGTMSNSKHHYDYTSNLKMNAYTLKGWEFKGWSLTPDGSAGIMPDCGSILNLTDIHRDVISLYAQWEIIYYDIFIRYSATEDYTFYITYNIETPTIYFPDVQKEGYKTVWTPDCVPQYSTGEQRATARFELKYFEIHYELNGGDDRGLNNPKIYNVEEHVELKAPTKAGYRFIGWKCNGKYITNLDGLIGNITIEAVWEPVYQLQVTDVSVFVFKEITNIILPAAQFNSSCKISVASSVRSLTITSSVNIQYSLCIEIEARSSNFDITLNNVNFKAPDNCEAISMASHYTLTVKTTGMCEIHGGNGLDGDKNATLESSTYALPTGFGGMGKMGGSAINCYKLVVNASNINIYGGNGGRGDDGFNISGGKGYSGGKGNNAIKVTTSVTFIGNNIVVVGGNGGNGGNGGALVVGDNSTTSANEGGSGGKGASAVLGEVIGSVELKNGYDGQDGYYGPIMMH